MNSARSSELPLPGTLDTIVALATPPGRGAIAIVRLSGPKAHEIAARLVDPWPTSAREIRLSTLRAGTISLDQALVTVYVAPESFTGEDAVEIFCHGGYRVPTSIIAALIDSGARQALPGEFTRRAVLNRKLDIAQAEAIGDLIDASSTAMQRAALYQLDGGLSSRISSLRTEVLGLAAMIAYDVDFPEEDDGPISEKEIINAGEHLLGSLERLLSTIPAGRIVKEGAVVVIAGEPNVGKSSLFNAMLGEQRAIVTEISGTTRDAIEAVIDAGNWPIRLIDTAGLRDSTDVVERLGIELSEQHISRAHLILVCGDSEASIERTLAIVRTLSSSPTICVLTKCDVVSEDGSDQGRSKIMISASAVTGAGLANLRAAIDEVLSNIYGEITPETPLLTRARHVHAIECAKAEIAAFLDAWTNKLLPAPVAAVHLQSAAIALEDVIGAVSTEDVLEKVFGSFCVGK